MDLLLKLLGIDVPENTTLQSAEVGFRAPMALWLAILALLAAAAVIFFLYRREQGPVGRLGRTVMALVRVALLVLLVLLLFRPILLTEFTGERPRHIALLLDNSQSMMQRDRRLTAADNVRVAIAKGLAPLATPMSKIQSQDAVPANTPRNPARADLVRWVLSHPQLALVKALEKHGPVDPYLFGGTLRGTQESSRAGKDAPALPILASFKADEARTSLADAVREILERKDRALPAAIVVLTDGQDNASKFTLQEAAVECSRRQVPLHVYGVGTAEGGSLQLKEIGAPETLFVEDSVTVPLRWRAQGFKKAKLLVTLKLGGKIVARQEIAARTGEDVRHALSFLVPKSNEQEKDLDLVATIEVKGDASFKDSLTRPVHVVNRKIRVLYVEHSPRFVYQFLMAALLRDRRIDPTFVLVQADPKVSQSGTPFLPAFPATRAQFFDAQYNVIILGDVAASYLGKEHMEWIKEFVQNRGGLVAVAGRQHMPASYVNTPLAEVLPAEFEVRKFALDADIRTQEYPVTLTDAGQRSDMLALADTPEDSVKEWAKLPGFHWHYPLNKLRPGSVSLLINPRAKMGDQPMPLLASQYYGKGQVLFMGSDETWRWRFNEADKVTNRFWGQLIYHLGLPSLLGQSSRRVEAALERSRAILGTPGSIFVRLLDKDFNPRKDPKVDAVLEFLDAAPGQEKQRKITLFAVPGQDGEYRAPLAHDQAGRWQLKLNNPQAFTFPFRVELPAGHELEENGLAENALRDMARVSGGRFYREEDLHELAASVEPKKTSFTARQEVILWNPLVLALFVMLITVEWLMRKFANLS
jgi:hypothetical protein